MKRRTREDEGKAWMLERKQIVDKYKQQISSLIGEPSFNGVEWIITLSDNTVVSARNYLIDGRNSLDNRLLVLNYLVNQAYYTGACVCVSAFGFAK